MTTAIRENPMIGQFTISGSYGMGFTPLARVDASAVWSCDSFFSLMENVGYDIVALPSLEDEFAMLEAASDEDFLKFESSLD